jgi:guanylate kinase
MPIVVKPEGMLIVLSSPSGGGKSSVCQALLKRDNRLVYSVSFTSRPPRGDEVNGQHYNFVSEDEFERLVQKECFYEWARVHGNLYGTRRDLVEMKLAEGRDIVLDLDVQGSLQIKHKNPKAVMVFILPPSMRVLEERLRKRNTDSDETINRRLHNARVEINQAAKYDYVVVNEDLQETIEIIWRIIESERHSVRHQSIELTGEDAIPGEPV